VLEHEENISKISRIVVATLVISISEGHWFSEQTFIYSTAILISSSYSKD